MVLDPDIARPKTKVSGARRGRKRLLSDVISSGGVVFGVAGLVTGWTVLDPVAVWLPWAFLWSGSGFDGVDRGLMGARWRRGSGIRFRR
jgi:hypothetical protein